MPDTLPWSPQPDEGDILTSTQVLGMGKGMEDKNEIAELTSRGYKIHRVKVMTLEEECGFALVSLWRERTDEERTSRRFTFLLRLRVYDAMLCHGLHVQLDAEAG